METQELIHALQEFLQMEQKMDGILQEKKALEEGIQYYQLEKKPPQPERPSRGKLAIQDVFLLLLATWFGGLLIGECFGAEPATMLPVLGVVYAVLLIVVIPRHYKNADKDALEQFVKAGVIYNEWEKGKQEKLPVLKVQLAQLMQNGNALYRDYQNAPLRAVLHADYLPHARTILGYFERGRVNSLSEAVNLLECDLREQRRDAQTAAYRYEMLRQAYAQTAAAEETAASSARTANAAEATALAGIATAMNTAAIQRAINEQNG